MAVAPVGDERSRRYRALDRDRDIDRACMPASGNSIATQAKHAARRRVYSQYRGVRTAAPDVSALAGAPDEMTDQHRQRRALNKWERSPSAETDGRAGYRQR